MDCIVVFGAPVFLAIQPNDFPVSRMPQTRALKVGLRSCPGMVVVVLVVDGWARRATRNRTKTYDLVV